MQKFSDLLSGYIHKKNVTLPELADYCNIDLSVLLQIVNGKITAPSKEKVYKFAQFLQLTPAERDTLTEAYYIDRFGHNTYIRRLAIHGLLSKEYIIKNESTSVFSSVFEEDFSVSLTLSPHISGETNVIKAAIYILTAELTKADGYVNLLLPASDRFRHIMYSVFDKNLASHDTKITHIFGMNSGNISLESNTGDNIRILSNILSVFTLYPSYIPLYFYANPANISEAYPLFPWLILTSRFALLCSANMEQGLFFDDPERIRFLTEMFEKRKNNSAKLLQSMSMSDLAHAYDTQTNFSLTATSKKRYIFQMIPGITPFLTEEELRRYFRPQGPTPEYREGLLMRLILHAEQTRKLTYDGRSENFVSLEGVREFLRTGIFPDYPQYYYEPFEPEDRIKIIKRMIESPDLLKIRLLKESIGSLMQGLSIVVEDTFVFLEILSTHNYCILNEKNLIDAFIDYFASVDEAMYYSDEETLRIIEGLMLEML